MNQMTVIANPEEVPRPATSLNDGPDSLISLLPPKVAAMILAALESHPHLFDKSETELFQYLRGEQATPTPSDNRLRIKFWIEYDRCRMRQERKLAINHVIAGICYQEYFYAHYLPNPFKLAWMVCMPTGYAVKTMESLEFGIDRMRSILEMEHMVNGKPNIQILMLKQKIVDMMHAWVKGAPVQRSLAVNVNTSRKAEALSTELTMEELQKQLANVERKNKLAKNLPLPDIEVTSE